MWKDLLEFTRGERMGIIALLVILFALIGFYLLLPSIEPEFHISHSDSLQIARWQQQMHQDKQDAPEQAQKSYYAKLYDTLELFRFNPNTISKEEWMALGLSKGQTKTIMNYRKSGGRFYEPEDVKKMYTIDAEQYAYLKPWINIPKQKADKQEEKPKTHKAEKPAHSSAPDSVFKPDTLFKFNPNKISPEHWTALGLSEKTAQTIKNYLASGARFNKPQDLLDIYNFPEKAYTKLKPYIKLPREKKILVELNTATRKELERLSGIGDYYSEMIVQYRNLLGGYFSKKQLLEVYNFRKSTYNKIKDKVKANPAQLTKIPIDTAGYETLIRHPYINKYQTKQILNLREKGKLNSINFLSKKKVFSDTIYQKVKHYLLMKTDN